MGRKFSVSRLFRSISANFRTSSEDSIKSGERNLRLGIIGTSNAISSRGYTSSLAEISGIEIIANASLGSSTSAVLPYRLQLLEDLNIDVLLIDTCVNEHAALGAGLLNLDLSAHFFKSTIAWCDERSIKPLLLVMPNRDALQLDASGRYLEPAILTHYRRLCEGHNVALVDGYALVDRLTGAGHEVGTLFDDPHHLAPDIQKLIAQAIGEALVVKRFHPRLEDPRRSTFVSTAQMTGVPPERRSHRRNSLVSVDLVRLEVGDKLFVKNKGKSEVVGIVFNMMDACPALSINGFVKRLDCCQPSPIPLRLVAWSFVEPIEVADGFDVKCVSVDGRPAERNEHNYAEDTLAVNSLELAGFIMRPCPNRSCQ